jgi:hypothetical protein
MERPSIKAIVAALAAAFAVLALSACRVPTATQPGAATVLISDYSGSFSYTANVGDGSHDVYFVFTNTNVSVSGEDVPTVKGLSVDGVELPALMAQPAGRPSGSSPSPLERWKSTAGLSFPELRAKAETLPLPGAAASPCADIKDKPGTTMYYWSSKSGDSLEPATCRFVSPVISTAQGSRILNIWVADDCWLGAGTGKKHYVDQLMVNALADEFLKSGPNDDIYDWVTDILGPEWGDTGYSNLIVPATANGADGEITILLADIQGDDSDSGGYVGYFSPANNYRAAAYKGSNERIMFVIDAVMYANPDAKGYSKDDTGYYTGGVWSPADSYWAKQCFSTLAHEFQHMINFYRKNVIVAPSGSGSEAWLDEMCSQLVEDLLSDKLEVPGPRGVAYDDYTAGGTGNYAGRIPRFNKYLSLVLTVASSSNYDLDDYSFSYSFGSWLLRNYGGAQFVKNVVYDHATDSQAIVDAVKAWSGKTYAISELLQRWAVAVLGSSRTDMPYGFRYNTGASFTSTSAFNSSTYTVGSINFFNYSPAPAILTSASLGATSSFPVASNLYYKAATGLSGSRTFQLHLPAGVGFSVYVTP